MGIIAFEWGQGKLSLLQNRDNWSSRNINAAAWDESGEILAGLPAPNGGTWFGCSTEGRVAFLVVIGPSNIFSPAELLPYEFVKSTKNPQLFAEELKQQEDKLRNLAFNLVVVDIFASGLMVHISKRTRDSAVVAINNVGHGVHVLTSRGLDKSESARQTFVEIFGLYPDIRLPQLRELTGRLQSKSDVTLSSYFADMGSFGNTSGSEEDRVGTTSTIVFAVKPTREAIFMERSFVNGEWTEHHPYMFLMK